MSGLMLGVNWLSAKDLIETFGTIGLILIVFIESGLLPVPLPGDSILVLAGAFCATNKAGDPHLNLAVGGARHPGRRDSGRADRLPARKPLRHPPVQTATPGSSRPPTSSGPRSSSIGAGRARWSSPGSSRWCARSCRCSPARGTCPQRKFFVANADRRGALDRRYQHARLRGRPVDLDRQVHPADRRRDHRVVVDPAVPRVPPAQSAQASKG